MHEEMFNKDQLDYMKYLSEQPRKSLCECGWYKKNECSNYHGCKDGLRLATKSFYADLKRQNGDSK